MLYKYKNCTWVLVLFFFLLTRVGFILAICAKCIELKWVQLVLSFCHVTKFEFHSKQRIHVFSSAVFLLLLWDLFFLIVLPWQYCFTRHDLLLSHVPTETMSSWNHANWIKNNKERMGTYSIYIGLNSQLEYVYV